MTMIIGFKSAGGNTVAVNAPNIEAAKDNGNNFPTIWKSTLPDLMKEIVDVNEPNELASLLVPKAMAGGIPVASRAGVDISPPPPTTASMKAAKKPNAIIMINICISIFIPLSKNSAIHG